MAPAYEYNARIITRILIQTYISHTHTHRHPSTLCMYGLPVSIQFLLFVLLVHSITVDFRKNPHCMSTLMISQSDHSCCSVEETELCWNSLFLYIPCTECLVSDAMSPKKPRSSDFSLWSAVQLDMVLFYHQGHRIVIHLILHCKLSWGLKRVVVCRGGRFILKRSLTLYV